MSDYRDSAPLYSYPTVRKTVAKENPNCEHIKHSFTVGNGWFCADCGKKLN